MVVLGSKTGLFQSLVSVLFSMYISGCISTGSDTLSINQSLIGNQTLVSKEGKFELGFFSSGNPAGNGDLTRYYLAIWYKNIPTKTVVWVANKNYPILQSLYNNSRLLLSNDGNLYLLHNQNTYWKTSLTTANSNATEAVLLDTGNLVMRDGGATTWQSFDYPTDTWLPGGRIGLSRMKQALASWKNTKDPSVGIYSIGLDPNGTAELFIWRLGYQSYWRSGFQNGTTYSFLYELQSLHMYKFSYVQEEDTRYITFNVSDQSAITRLVMDISGQLKLLTWSGSERKWLTPWQRPVQPCEVYAACGAFGLCNSDSTPVCSCLPGFVPKSEQGWYLGDFSEGCIRKNTLECGADSIVGFQKLSNIRVPAFSQSLAGVNDEETCKSACLRDCSCNAFVYGSNGSCLLSTGDLLDLKIVENSSTLSDGFYLKLNSVEHKGKGPSYRLPLAVSLVSGALILGSLAYYLWRRKQKREGDKVKNQNLLLLDLNTDPRADNRGSTKNNSHGHAEEEIKNYELAMFSFSSVAAATNHFSTAKKLGEGGFGPVYKGELLNGQSVAVKRLSKSSGQGLEEFRNETELIAKLQHRNLVGILGCCTEKDEMILVYEYMPNKSLDSFLFDPLKRNLLDWGRRVKIIEGIAQGLLYLHQYSRLRIVHRDLKASNILLDGDMNPKISDFGMARIFGENKLQANTNRIVGTYGYMSPEYVAEGVFSIKSDVFAFGVLLLEILSGKKNIASYGSDSLSLAGHAWELWNNDRALELIDPAVQIPCSSIPLRFILLGLLCVQDNAADRPTMSNVVAMLSNEQTSIASPKEPAFTTKRIASCAHPEEGKLKISSVNDLTISSPEAR